MKSLQEQLSELSAHIKTQEPPEKCTNDTAEAQKESHLDTFADKRDRNATSGGITEADTTEHQDCGKKLIVQQSLVKCPFCNTLLKESNLKKHISRTHQLTTPNLKIAVHKLKKIENDPATEEALNLLEKILHTNKPLTPTKQNTKTRSTISRTNDKTLLTPALKNATALGLKDLREHMKVDNPKHGDKKIKKAFLLAARHYAMHRDKTIFNEIAKQLPLGVWHNRLIDFKLMVLNMSPEQTLGNFAQIRAALDEMVSTIGYQDKSSGEKRDLPSRKLPTSSLHRKLMSATLNAQKTGNIEHLIKIITENTSDSGATLGWIRKYTPYSITKVDGEFVFFKEPFKSFNIAGARRDVIYGKGETKR